jgi:hypothetical protein
MYDLILFIRKQINGYDLLINESSQLENDLSITGDDAYEFIKTFSKHYKVDISNFVFSKYFYEEPNAFTTQYHPISPLKVGDLAKAIAAGKLDDEVIGS